MFITNVRIQNTACFKYLFNKNKFGIFNRPLNTMCMEFEETERKYVCMMWHDKQTAKNIFC